MTDFEYFLNNLTVRGLEQHSRFYSLFDGYVLSNKDPNKCGRVQVYIPYFKQTATNPLGVWIEPAFEYAGRDGTHGSFWPPEEGDVVRVAFWDGNPSEPICYLGGTFPNGKVPTKLGHDKGGDSTTGTKPIKRGWVTKSGHSLTFNDKSGEEAVSLTWKDDSASVTIDAKGTVTIKTGASSVVLDKEGKQVQVTDENSNTITLNSDGVSIKTSNSVQVEGSAGVKVTGASIDLSSSAVNLTSDVDDSAVKGNALLQWLAQHTHGTGVGPSSPPVVPPGPDILSLKAKLG